MKRVVQKYSVLMAVYVKDNPEYFAIALDSMIHQTVPPDEIVIVKDGPITEELQAILDDRKNIVNIHEVALKDNHGLGFALNEGIKACRNELIARMDADDISKPERCEKQLKRFSKKPELAIVGTHIDEFADNISHIISQRKVPLTTHDIYAFAKRRSAFNHPTVMYRKSKVLEYGGYANLRRNQDVDLFGRMLYGGCLAENLDESLLWFRTSNGLTTRRKSRDNSWSYIQTIKRFWRMGYASLSDVLIVAAAQLGVYVMPDWLQRFIYKSFLRS